MNKFLIIYNVKVGVIDSGIGGLATINIINKTFKNISYYFICDNKNIPYGNKDCDALYKILFTNVAYLLRFEVDVIIIACNTMSVLFLDKLKNIFSIPIIGVVPPVDRDNEKTLLIATENTIKNLTCNKINKVAINELALIIENEAPACDKAIKVVENLNVNNYNTLVLGCTHYLFIKEQLKKLYENVSVVDGTTNTLIEFKKYYKKSLRRSVINYFITSGQDINLKDLTDIKTKKIRNE